MNPKTWIWVGKGVIRIRCLFPIHSRPNSSIIDSQTRLHPLVQHSKIITNKRTSRFWQRRKQLKVMPLLSRWSIKNKLPPINRKMKVISIFLRMEVQPKATPLMTKIDGKQSIPKRKSKTKINIKSIIRLMSLKHWMGVVGNRNRF